MPLLVCQDFSRLEVALFRRIEAVKSNDPLAPIAVVVPTGRILTRLRRVIRDSGRSYLGLHLLHHRAFAERILESRPSGPLRIVGTEILTPILEGILESRPEGPSTRYARSSRGALTTLLGTLRDLRDAHVVPDRFRRIREESGDLQELGEIHASFCRAMDRLEEEGLTDNAGCVKQAIRYAPESAFLGELRAVLHYGAYDLIQIHQDLLEAVAPRVEVTLLVPGISPAPAFAFARRFLETPLAQSLGPPEEVAVSRKEKTLLSENLAHLYDDESPPPDRIPAGGVEVITAAGAWAELEAVARRALAAHASGIPLQEIGVVARTLEPYAAHLEAVFGAFSLPYVTSAAQPLLRYPGPRSFLQLLRVLDDDFPRFQVVDLLRSPAIRLEGSTSQPGSFHPDRWDRWSRQAWIVGGREAWLDRLPAWAREEERRLERRIRSGDRDPDTARRLEWYRLRTADCERLSGLIRSLAAEADLWDRKRSWREHARFLTRLSERMVREEEDGEAGGPRRDLLSLLETLADLDSGERAAGMRSRPVSRSEARKKVETLLAAATHGTASTAVEGLAVLDAMQARGESFRLLFLIGLSSDQWPRRIHPDPFFPDLGRGRLRSEIGTQIPVKEASREEERLLLALLLGAARERLILSYQRADDDGRARAHATAWREIARVTRGRAESAALLGGEEGVGIVPTDPASRARFELARTGGGTGLLTFQEAAVLAADSAPDPVEGMLGQLKRLGRSSDRILRGGEYVRSVNRWDPGDLSRDGKVGPILKIPEFLSATRIETLGRCPLQYFFRYGLGIEELEDPENRDLLDLGIVGTMTHTALEKIYRRLIQEGDFPIQADRDIADRALHLLEEVVTESSQPLREILEPRHPLLWSIYSQEWRRSLRNFLRFDLKRLHREGAIPVHVELDIEEKIPLRPGEPGVSVGLRGRIDRIDRLPGDRLRVVDYKTSGNLTPLVDANGIRQGKRPQLGVYVFLAVRRFAPRRIASAQILGVGPEHPDPESHPEEAAPCLEVPDNPSGDKVWRRIGDTLHNLSEIAREGWFPFNEDRHCGWCDYRSACRRLHPPTADRVESAPEYSSFRRLSEPSGKNPLGGEKVS